jgi:hypothetical protein
LRFEACAADEDGLVAEVQHHAGEERGMALTHAEALLLVSRAELDEKAPSCTPVGEAAHDPSDDNSSNR